MSEKFKKIKVSYKKYGDLMLKLEKQIRSSNVKFDCLHGFIRGGLPLAVHFSHKLNIPMEMTISSCIRAVKDGKNVLLIDDIVDTGMTFLTNARRIINSEKCFTASLYYKPHSKFKPDFHVVKTLDWICFPWELFDEKPNRELYKNL